MKVHLADMGCFAGAEAFRAAGFNYVLQTYHQIRNAKDKLATNFDVINSFQHTIIDSGMFSYMFGCEKDRVEVDDKFCKSLLNDYVNFINKSPFERASFVELDVQKKLGVEAAWEYRKEMKARINKGTVINVYHLEDENPDRLIDFADYIAVSIPELRFNVDDKERYRIARYIAVKATRMGKRVHLLGCTEKKMMKQFQFCYSCDSTSWNAGKRYGRFKSDSTGDRRVEPLYLAGAGGFESKYQKYNYLASGILKLDYEKYAGDQS